MLQRLRGRSGRETEASGLAAENARLRAENGELRGTVVELRATIAQQQARIDGLELVVSQLQGKLSISSRNSSKPPSSDGPEVPPGPPKNKPQGRKVGAQPGHAGSTRAPVPIEQVDVVKDLRPLACEACGLLLMGEDPSPVRRQIIDIPPPKVIVTEYRCASPELLGLRLHHPGRSARRSAREYLWRRRACAGSAVGRPVPAEQAPGGGSV